MEQQIIDKHDIVLAKHDSDLFYYDYYRSLSKPNYIQTYTKELESYRQIEAEYISIFSVIWSYIPKIKIYF